jgi:hypothetical protein
MARLYDNQARLLKGMYKKALEGAGHVFFERGVYNVNIIGIRSKEKKAGKFDDNFAVVYKDKAGQWIVDAYRVTTDPGAHYLKDKTKWYGPHGVAVLMPGQYRGAYMVGSHGSSKYEALVQRGATVRIARDGNLDDVADADPGNVRAGWYGINIHASSVRPYTEEKTTSRVGPWSAGCQVFKNTLDFREFMKLIKTSAKYHGDKFSYTLIEEKDLEV